MFVAFDLETTGLVPGRDRIVEIGAVRFTLERDLADWEELVDPGVPIQPAAQAVNRISDAMVRGRPPVAEALPRFLSFLGDGIPVAHNAPFDVGFLSRDLVRLGLPAPAAPVLDTRTLAQKAWPRRQSYALAALAAAYTAGGAGVHRACADAVACAALLRAVLARLDPLGGKTVGEIASRVAPLDLGGKAPRTATLVEALQAARDAGGTVEIRYQNGRGEATERRIAPLEILIEHGKPAVEAFCHLRGEKRTFYLERIEDIRT